MRMIEYKIVKVGNYGTIIPIPIGGLANTLDKYLSYERKGKEFMPNPLWATVHLYSIKKGTYPWGLTNTVRKVLDKYCEKTGDKYYIAYTFMILEELINKVDTITGLRDYQKEAIKTLITHNGGIMVMPCGAGKTITIVEYLKIMNKKALVLCPTKDIRTQWERYGLSTLVASTYQNPKLKEQKYLEQYDIIVMDECHHSPCNTLYKIAMKIKTNTILIGCSATIYSDKKIRDDGEDMKIFAALGQITYNITRSELVKQGWLVNAKVIYLQPRFKTDGKYMDYPTVYRTEIIENMDRNERIVEIALREWQRGHKTLILVSHIIHGQKIFEEINTLNLYTPPPKIIFVHGKSKDRDQDMNKYDIIIASSIYDEGYDLKNLDRLILAGSGKSQIKITQRVGRILRPAPNKSTAIIYDFIDTPKYLKKQYLLRREQLSEDFEIEEVPNLDREQQTL